MNNTHLILMIFCFQGCFSTEGGDCASPNIEFSREHGFFIEEYDIQGEKDDEISKQIESVWTEHTWHYVRSENPGLFGEVFKRKKLFGRFSGSQFVFKFKDNYFLQKHYHILSLGNDTHSRLKRGGCTIDIDDNSQLLTKDTLMLEYTINSYCNELLLIKRKNYN